MSLNLQEIPMSKIMEPSNPSRMSIDRSYIEELADSMKSRGLLQPITVRAENDSFRIEAGHCRFLAATLLGWENINAIIQDVTHSDDLHLDRAHENLIRADLNPVEESRIVWDLVYEDGRGVERTSTLLCKTPSWVETRLEIAKFADDIKESLSRREIKVAVARELDKIKDADQRKRVLASTIEYGASANVVRGWISDSQIGPFLGQSEVAGALGECNVIDRSVVTMPCRICSVSHNIDSLRHIWICPHCLSAVNELSIEVRRMLSEPVSGEVE